MEGNTLEHKFTLAFGRQQMLHGRCLPRNQNGGWLHGKRMQDQAGRDTGRAQSAFSFLLLLLLLGVQLDERQLNLGSVPDHAIKSEVV